MRKVWEELEHGDYVYVRRNGEKLLVSACMSGKTEHTELSRNEVRWTTLDLVLVTLRRLVQRLRNASENRRTL